MTIDLTPEGTAVGVLASVSIQCDDAARLAAFYQQLLGGTETFRTPDDSVVCICAGTIYLTAMHVEDYLAPEWPAPGSGGIVHLDIAVDELTQTVARAVQLGAEVAEHQPNPQLFRVLLDPAGHPFCLTTARP